MSVTRSVRCATLTCHLILKTPNWTLSMSTPGIPNLRETGMKNEFVISEDFSRGVI
jgi:hypothetical protein